LGVVRPRTCAAFARKSEAWLRVQRLLRDTLGTHSD
jgi:hypothetical protein